jgi:hypothetical protein
MFRSGKEPEAVRLSIPMVAELARIIAADPSTGMTFLSANDRAPYTADAVGNVCRNSAVRLACLTAWHMGRGRRPPPGSQSQARGFTRSLP